MNHPRLVFGRIAEYPAKLWRWISGKFFWSFSFLGISSLLWVIFRSGARPTRLIYPCQRIAFANVHAWAGVSLLALLHRLRWKVRKLLVLSRAVPLALAVGGVAVAGLLVARAFEQPSGLSPQELRRAADRMTEILSPSSSVFVVETGGGPDGLSYVALDRLIDLMGVHGASFYRSEKPGIACSPTGLIGSDDVILIKVNCQWDQRGGTNTDLLKGLIYRLTQHPDGFTGEVVVADNGQDVGIGGSLDWANSNAEDHGQSAQDVVNLFSGSYKVSTYLWTVIRNRAVGEFDAGDSVDGYVHASSPYPGTSFRVSYPKFTTPSGTRISLKNGIYKPGKPTGTYDKEKLKVINVPVLKSHSGFGATASVKHYMGVQSQPLSNAHGQLSNGSMGCLFADLGLPTLNIVDAIWVNPNPMGQSGCGPSTSYTQATRVDTLIASLDPFALDYWASKNVLMPAAIARGYSDVSSMDPDTTGVFRTYLLAAKNIVLRAGHAVTTDPKSITVFKASDERPLLTDMTLDGAGNISLKWLEIAPGSFSYTVEQAADLQGAWEPVPGTTWPILDTQWSGESGASAGVSFYRVRRDRGPKQFRPSPAGVI